MARLNCENNRPASRLPDLHLATEGFQCNAEHRAFWLCAYRIFIRQHGIEPYRSGAKIQCSFHGIRAKVKNVKEQRKWRDKDLRRRIALPTELLQLTELPANRRRESNPRPNVVSNGIRAKVRKKNGVESLQIMNLRRDLNPRMTCTPTLLKNKEE
jgi:hypothetical protein